MFSFRISKFSLLKLFAGLVLGFGLIQIQPVAAQSVAESPPLASPSTKSTLVSSDSAVLIAPPETPINLTISPISLNLFTKPGVMVRSEMKLRNNGTEVEQLSIKVGTFIADSTGEHPELLDVKPTDVFISWLSVDTTPFVLNPGEWKTIPLEFAPPADAALSYYYTLIVNRTTHVKATGTGTIVSGSPALLVLANVDSPNARKELQLVSFRVLKPFLEYLPGEFEVKIKNTGNVHLAPSGNIFIDGQGKKDIAVLSLNPLISLILPQTTRTFLVKWTDGFPVFMPKLEDDKELHDANGKVITKLVWDFSKADRLRVGKFVAHLLMVYDNGERDVPIESGVSFWTIPWKLLGLFLLVLVLTLFGLFTVGRNLVRLIRKDKKR